MGACLIHVSRARNRAGAMWGSPHGAKWVGLLDGGTACGRPPGPEGTTGRGSLLPAVTGVAAAERDVLHLEEVAAVLELEETAEEFSFDELIERSQHPRVVAIGETGLDYHWCQGDLAWQHNRFRVHIQAAKTAGVPLIIHTRSAPSFMPGLLSGMLTTW